MLTFTKHKWDPQLSCKDLVNVIERILLVDKRVKQNTKCPNILRRSVVFLALQHLGRSVVKRPAEGIILSALAKIGGAAKVDQLHGAVLVQNHILILDVAMHNLVNMQVLHRLYYLPEDRFNLALINTVVELNIVKQIHSGAV